MINLYDIIREVDGVKHYDLSNTIQYLNYRGKAMFGPGFKIHPIDYKVIDKILSWIIHDVESCKRYNLSPDKGILLIGPVGCGKTSLMTLVASLLPRKRVFTIKPSREITIEFGKQGYDVIYKYSRSARSPLPICLDDIGIEPPMQYFGTKINVIAEVLLSRYDLYRSKGVITYGTTNLNADELEYQYGNRVRSRLREMFNIISYDANSPDKRV